MEILYLSHGSLWLGVLLLSQGTIDDTAMVKKGMILDAFFSIKAEVSTADWLAF